MRVLLDYIFSIFLVLVLVSMGTGMIRIYGSTNLGVKEEYRVDDLTQRVLGKLLSTPGYPLDWGSDVSINSTRYDGLVDFGLSYARAAPGEFVLDPDKVQRLYNDPGYDNPYYVPPRIAADLLGLGRDYGFRLTIKPAFSISASIRGTLVDIDVETWERTPISNANVTIIALTPGEGGLTWWDERYSYGRQIELRNGLPYTLTSGYSVCLTIDTASLVLSDKMQASGDDLRVARWDGEGWTELSRHLVDMNSASTQVWFETQSDIPAGSLDTSYYVYYGDPNAVNPPADPMDVFEFYDDFSKDTLGDYEIGRWLSLHGSSDFAPPSYDGANERINFDTGDNMVTGLRLGINGTDLYAELKVRWESSYPLDTTVGIGLRWTDLSSCYMGHVAHDRYVSPAIAKDDRTNYLATPGTDTHFPKDGTWHKLAFGVWEDNLKLWLDDVEYLSTSDLALTGSGEVVFEFAQIGGSADDFLVRRYAEPEPTASLSEEFDQETSLPDPHGKGVGITTASAHTVTDWRGHCEVDFRSDLTYSAVVITADFMGIKAAQVASSDVLTAMIINDYLVVRMPNDADETWARHIEGDPLLMTFPYVYPTKPESNWVVNWGSKKYRIYELGYIDPRSNLVALLARHGNEYFLVVAYRPWMVNYATGPLAGLHRPTITRLVVINGLTYRAEFSLWRMSE